MISKVLLCGLTAVLAVTMSTTISKACKQTIGKAISQLQIEQCTSKQFGCYEPKRP